MGSVASLRRTHKKPVLIHQLAFPFIIRGVQKLNMIETILEKARAEADVRAFSRCCGISVAHA